MTASRVRAAESTAIYVTGSLLHAKFKYVHTGARINHPGVLSIAAHWPRAPVLAAAAKSYLPAFSLATRYCTSSMVCSKPPADEGVRRYLPLTTRVGVLSTL